MLTEIEKTLLFCWLGQTIEKYFQNPTNIAKFEIWQNERNCKKMRQSPKPTNSNSTSTHKLEAKAERQ